MAMGKAKMAFFVGFGIAAICVCFEYIADRNRTEVKVFITPVESGTEPVTDSTAASEKPVKTTKYRENSTIAASTETAASPVTEPESLHININTADADELAKLKGIGEHIAAEIISYREACGGFANIEELMKVSGIGKAIFAEIEPFVYVDEPYYPDDEYIEEPYEEPVHELTLEDVCPIDLNTADTELLMLLPGVDEEIAERIIAFREEAGRFTNVRELLYIEGLSRDHVVELMEYVTVEP